MNESSPTAPRDHFSQIVPKWSQFGPPLRPWPDDSAVVQCVASTLHAGAHAVVLGLTPEIIACDWPVGVKLSAVDHSPAMIEQLWPPAKGPADSEVLLADWAAMPIESGTIDMVAGDGCYVLQSWPDGYAALTREVGRVLRPGGAMSSACSCGRTSRNPLPTSRAIWPLAASAACMRSSCVCSRPCTVPAEQVVVSAMSFRHGQPCRSYQLCWQESVAGRPKKSSVSNPTAAWTRVITCRRWPSFGMASDHLCANWNASLAATSWRSVVPRWCWPAAPDFVRPRSCTRPCAAALSGGLRRTFFHGYGLGGRQRGAGPD